MKRIFPGYLLLTLIVFRPLSGAAGASPTNTPSSTLTPSFTHTSTFTHTYTPSGTPTSTPTPSRTITATPSPTFTPTPTATLPYEFWQDDFIGGTPGIKPSGWQDESDDNTFNAHIAYSYTDSYAAVTRTAESDWGKALSPAVHCNVDIYNWVEVRITDVSPSTTWKIGIQEVESPWEYKDLNSSSSAIGTFRFEFASIMNDGSGWTGEHDFYIQLTVEGYEGRYIEVDYVSVHKPQPTSTPTSTPTITLTPTQTPTPENPTPTPDLTAVPDTEIADFWHEPFVGTPGAQPQGWTDESDANIFYSAANSCAKITQSAGSEGSVLSPEIRCFVHAYSILEIKIASVSPSAAWKVGILESGTLDYWDLCSGQSGNGCFRFDYAGITGLDNERKFKVRITVSGGVGENVTIDSVRIFGLRRAAPANDFVTIDESEPEQLALNGTVIKLKGVNYYPSAHGWEKMWPEWDPDLLHTELARCQQLGFNSVRACIHYQDVGGPDVKPEMLARAEEFLYIAGKYGLRVHFVFVPFIYKACPEDPANWNDIKTYLCTILERFRDDSRIWAWSITNEIDLHVTMTCSSQSDADNIIAWHNEMAAYLKTIDANHILVAASSRPETLEVLDMSNLDVFALHTGGMLDAQKGMIMRTRQLMQKTNTIRPIIFEEFGINFGDGYSPEEVSAFFNLVWEQLYTTDIAGGMIWILNDTEFQSEPHLWGLFQTNGAMKPGVPVILSAYTGTDFKHLQAVTRSQNPLQVVVPALGREEIWLNTQLPDLEAKWTPVRAKFTPEAEGVRIYDVERKVDEPYGYGHIMNVQAFSLDMDPAADLRINIPAVNGQWYAFLKTDGYMVRMQLDTPAKGEFIYNLSYYLPDEFQHGVQDFFVEVGASETTRTLDQAWVLVEKVSAMNGPRLEPTPTVTPTPTPWLEEGRLMIYPNPASDRVILAYRFSGCGRVEIDFYNIMGERVAHIREDKDHASGQEMKTIWHCAGVASGIYFCRVTIKDSQGREIFRALRKIALIK